MCASNRERERERQIGDDDDEIRCGGRSEFSYQMKCRKVS